MRWLLKTCFSTFIWSLAAAFRWRGLRVPNFDTDGNVVITENESFEALEVKALVCPGAFSNLGRFLVLTLSGATLNFNQYTNFEGAMSTFAGKQELIFISDASIVIFPRSTFQVSSSHTLRVTMLNEECAFVNGGKFQLKSRNQLLFLTNRSIFNNGHMIILSRNSGYFEFGDIHNSKLFVARSHSVYDHVSVRNLVNSGNFVAALGRGLSSTFDIGGAIDNTGLIKFYSVSGQMRFYQRNEAINSGLLCLRGISFVQMANTHGNGCWSLIIYASIHLDMRLDFDRSSSILLGATTTFVYVTNIHTSSEPINLYGVKKAHAFVRSDVRFMHARYNPSTGNLQLSRQLNVIIIFHLGFGYEWDSFEIRGTSIFYSGRMPPSQTIPPKCRCDNLTDPPQES